MPPAQAVEGVWEQRWWRPALEKDGGRRGHKVEVVHKAKDLRAVGILPARLSLGLGNEERERKDPREWDFTHPCNP